MADDPPRSRAARAAAERALVRVVHHYGGRPEFVLLGGLVPDLLCSTSGLTRAGTTDVDVQIDLEVAGGAVNTRRLERALRNPDFHPDAQQIWRWIAEGPGPRTVVKFELLADLATQPAETMISFDDSDELGAMNLRGTGFAARDDVEVRQLRARVGGVEQVADINVTGLAGFLLAKCVAPTRDSGSDVARPRGRLTAGFPPAPTRRSPRLTKTPRHGHLAVPMPGGGDHRQDTLTTDDAVAQCERRQPLSTRWVGGPTRHPGQLGPGNLAGGGVHPGDVAS